MYKNPNPHEELSGPTYKLTPPPPPPTSAKGGNANSSGRELPEPTHVLKR